MKNRRSTKFIKPALQLKVIAAFTATALLSLVFQAALMARAVSGAGNRSAEEWVVSSVTLDAVWSSLLITSAILVPASIVFGALVTHRIAGPVYRFECYLTDIAEDSARGPCRIRKGDELHELCAAINRATWERRAESGGQDAESSAA